eukprot:NODE_152_length_16986_cov_0.478119.p16 type:complete len:102 gc:universal NODE_152_length_16986_cov_0.478119:12109-12414(+)
MYMQYGLLLYNSSGCCLKNKFRPFALLLDSMLFLNPSINCVLKLHLCRKVKNNVNRAFSLLCPSKLYSICNGAIILPLLDSVSNDSSILGSHSFNSTSFSL